MLFILTQLIEIAKYEKVIYRLENTFNRVCKTKLWDRLNEIKFKSKHVEFEKVNIAVEPWI